MLSAAIRAKKGGLFRNLLGVISNVPLSQADAEATAVIALIWKMFPDKGPWDAKVPLGEAFSVHDPASSFLDLGDGSEVNYDVFGNVIYGYMLAYAGVEESNAIDAANLDISSTGVADTRDDVSITGTGAVDEAGSGVVQLAGTDPRRRHQCRAPLASGQCSDRPLQAARLLRWTAT